MKKYIVEFTAKSAEEFLALPSDIQLRIKRKMEFFMGSGNHLHFAKRLRGVGVENMFHFRIGDYRLIVMTKAKNIYVILVILKIGHRREVYE